MDKRVSRLIKIIRNSQPFFGASNLKLDWSKTHMVAIGKGAGSLVRQMEPSVELEGILITKSGAEQESKKWKTCFGGHPYITQESFNSALELVNYLKRVQEDEHLLFCLTGGASALVELPVSYFSNEEVAYVNEELLRSGADISEMNILRKELSQIKNGGLLTFCKARKITTLAISDVPYDGEKEMSLIGSSPCLYKEAKVDELTRIIESYILTTELKEKLLRYVVSEARKEDNLKKKEAFEATEFNYYVLSNHQKIIGECIVEYPNAFVEKRPFSATMKEGIERLIVEMKREGKGRYISCGEFNVQVIGDGEGGRNTHFVLAMAYELFEKKLLGDKNHFICSIGTDGSDGPTTAAGAWITKELYEKAKQMGLNPLEALQTFNTYHFFDKLGSLIVTGPTFNNLMDLRMIEIVE